MVKLVDTLDLSSSPVKGAGSSPARSTKYYNNFNRKDL